MREVGRFGFTNIGLSNTTTRFVTVNWLGMISAYGLSGRVDFLFTGSLFDDIGLLRADGRSYVWGAGQRVDESRVRGVIAGAVAEALATAWLGRSSYEAALPPDWPRLEPTDVVDVAFSSGTQFRIRLSRVDIGADFSLRLEGVSETVARYVSAAIADAGQGRPVQLIAGEAATRLILLDLPLLRDIDDAAGAGSRLYYLIAGYGAPGWPGAALYRSSDGSAWSQVGRALGEAAWGAAVNALDDPRSCFSTDEDNSLTIFMTTGGERLESVTQAAMLNGANAAVFIKASGEPEVIQFRDVTLDPDGSFTLTGLLRGRRGTGASGRH